MADSDCSKYDSHDQHGHMNGKYKYVLSVTLIVVISMIGIVLYSYKTDISVQDMNPSVETSNVLYSVNTDVRDIQEPRTSSSTSSQKPHIILILADDMGWTNLGSDDNKLAYASPVLNDMAKNGVILKNYYAQEVCTPARAALLTGRLPFTLGMQYFMVQSAIPWGLSQYETILAGVLSDNGYSTHMVGKWHLGHSSARLLPTGRGFDTFIGMLNGESNYWSKRNLDHSEYRDFLISDQKCYSPYLEEDLNEYSTHLYRKKAVQIIEGHDASKPLFLFLSFQAVHDPFSDIYDTHDNGITADYLDDDIYHKITTTVKGQKRQQYMMALNIMDEAIGEVVQSLKDNSLYDNSIIIFSSDNGGCYGGGGMNGPLRGTKGSLFEGGVKVDAFIHSPLLTKSKGTIYEGLFHISDWFPTILDMSGINFVPDEYFPLDGVSHSKALANPLITTYPRTEVLYNIYDRVDLYNFDIYVNGSLAIRNERYKLIHAFESPKYSAWYDTDESMAGIDDDLDAEIRCAPQLSINDGDFTYYLFDMVNDPFERNNLYYSGDPSIEKAKDDLYDRLQKYYENSAEIDYNMDGNPFAFDVWQNHDGCIVPYTREDYSDIFRPFPFDCY